MDKAMVNHRIKDFSLSDQHNSIVSTEELLKHKYVVLYFYAKDNTAG